MKVLDATILVDVLRRVPAAKRMVERLEQLGPLTATEIGSCEIYLGAQRMGARRKESEMTRINDLLDQMNVLPFERRSAIRAAEIGADLRRRGQTIGVMDLFTAAIALGHGATSIVTRNATEFRRIPGLRVETY